MLRLRIERGLDVYAVLKRDLLVGARTVIERDSRSNGLEVEVMEWEPQRTQKCFQPVAIHTCRARPPGSHLSLLDRG